MVSIFALVRISLKICTFLVFSAKNVIPFVANLSLAETKYHASQLQSVVSIVALQILKTLIERGLFNEQVTVQQISATKRSALCIVRIMK